MSGLRRVVRWTLMALVACRLALAALLISGIAVPTLVLRAMEASILAPVVACALFFHSDYRRHRRASLSPRAAALAAADDMFPLAFRRLVVHEVRLFTSFVRWISFRGPQGVQEGDVVVRYAAGQTLVVAAVLFASVVETVGLGFVIPWPVVRDVVLIVDLWGVYFIIALQASCIVHPHLVRADGSLLLRYGALAEIPIPAARIARARLENRLDSGGPLKLRADGSLDMGMGGQTMVTVELTEPVRFVRPLGKPGQARLVRFYAGDPGAAVATLTARLRSLT